jgi:alkylhydroperoxidase family enzyme
VTTEAELGRIDRFESEDFTAAEKAVLRFTEAFYRDHRAIPDAVWDDLKRHYAEPEIIELAWTIAAYIMLGKLIRAFRIPYGDEATEDHSPQPGQPQTARTRTAPPRVEERA